MDLKKGIKLKELLAALALPLIVGGLAALLNREGFALYGAMYKPLFSPPGWLFPVVWTVLYLLMGLASYLVWTAPVSAPRKGRALRLYILQLAVNFFWPLLFFGWGLYTAAFVWLLFLGLLVLMCAVRFHYISPTAGLLLLPYLLWLAYAAYLNLGVALFN